MEDFKDITTKDFKVVSDFSTLSKQINKFLRENNGIFVDLAICMSPVDIIYQSEYYAILTYRVK